MADDEVDIVEETRKLPFSDRVAHPNWKVRSAAFEDIRDKCSRVFDEDDPVLSDLVSLFPKSVTDSNAATLDKALDALAVFLSKCSEQHAQRICDKTCSNMVAKCLSGRPGTVVKCTEVFLAFIEQEQGERVLGALVEGFAHKVPKAAVAALEILYQAICAFGAKVIPIQPILKAAPSMLDSKDSKARAKIKDIVVEIARWVGADIIRSTLLDKVRDVIKTELEAAFGQLPSDRARPERLTRKNQQKEVDGDAAGPADGAAQVVAAVEEELPMEADAYDFVDPKDIIPELKKDFWEGLASKKWSDRKASLTMLRELASYPKLQPGDYGDVNREIKKIVTKDSMVQVVAEAIMCCGMFAKGLRSSYSGTAKSLCPTLLDKFKEKNANVQKAISETLVIMHKYCFSIIDVAEDVVVALAHQNPKVKEESIKWLSEAVAREAKPNLSKAQATLLPAIGKCAEDAAPSLREAAMTLLVAYAVKLGSATAIDKVTTKMDEAKKKKIEELFEEAMRSRPGQRGTSKPAAPSAAAIARSSAPATKPSAPSWPSSSKPAVRASVSKPAESSAPKTAKDDAEDEGSLLSGSLSKEEAEGRFTELFGESTVQALQDAQWKARMEAMDSVIASASGMPEHCNIIIQGIGFLPGWSEKISQVTAKVIELVAQLAKEAPTFSKRDVFACIPGLTEKIADAKLSGPVMDALSNMAEAVGPQFVSSQLHKRAAAHKNPKVLCSTLTWIMKTIEEFGLRPMNVKALLDWMKEDLGSANAPVRAAAIALLGAMHRFLGAPLAEMLRADVKPALMTVIEAEFAKNPQTGNFSAARMSRAAVAAGTGAGAAKPAASSRENGKAAKSAAPAAALAESFDADDMLPRTDISEEISSQVVGKLGSANWKERKEAMDNLDTLLQSAGYRIQSQVADLFPALKPRMSDTNRNLTVQALQLIGKLAKSMGKAIDRHGRVILPSALKNMSDPKLLVRGAVLEMLEAWAEAASPVPLVQEVVETLAAPKCSAEGRKSALEWLVTIADSGKMDDCLADGVKGAALGSMDKAVEVREASGRLMTALIENMGASEVGQAAHTLGTTHKKAALELYAKVTGGNAPSVSASTTSTSSSRPSTASRSSTASRASISASANLRSSTTKLAGTRPRAGSVVSQSASAASMSAMSGGSNEDGPIVKMDDKKDERAKKARFKPAKFDIKPDEAASLELELKEVVSPSLFTLMSHKDFKKHCEAADLLKANLDPLYDNIISCLDLLLRWAVLRIVDANTQSLVRILDMLKALFQMFVEREYRLSDYEAKVLIPAVVEKSGHNQDRIRADHREILKKACMVYSSVKVMAFVKDGLDSKNNRARVESAEEIGSIIDRAAAPIAKYQDGIQAVAKLVNERDTNLRKAVLSTMEIVYQFEGDGLWKLTGRLTDQQKSLIEERLKYVDKQLAKKGLNPGYRRAEAAVADEDAASTAAPSVSASVSSSRIGLPAGATFQAPTSISLPFPMNGGNSQSNSPTMDTKDQSASLRGSTALTSSSLHTMPSIQLQSVAPGVASSYQAPQSGSDMSPQPASLFSKKTDDEMMAEFNKCMTILRTGNVEDSVEVMKSLCYQLMELPRLAPPTVQMFKTNIDELVRLLASKTDKIFTHATVHPNGKDVPNARACKYSLNTLMNIFQSKSLPANISEDGIKELISVLLMRILDAVLPSLSEGSSMLKAVNVLMLKVLDNSNRTYSFGSLIGLLLHPHPGVKDAPAEEKLEHRWSEVVVKCLIKLTKTMSQYIETINSRQLLMYIHNYLHELGQEEVKVRGFQEDKPLRMVKTVLHELCRLKGRDIYRYTDTIPNSSPPPLIFNYIELNLNTLANRPAPAETSGPTAASAAGPDSRYSANVASSTSSFPPGYATGDSNGAHAAESISAASTSSAATRSMAAAVPGPVSAASDSLARTTLASIFKRLGSKEEPERALRELHHFMIEHPHIDVNQFLSTASENFRNFIHKGLTKVKAMDGQNNGHTTSEPTTTSTAPEPEPSTASHPAPAAAPMHARPEAPGLAELRDRMNKIQGDLSNTQAGTQKAPDRTVQDLRERMKAMQSKT